MSGSVLDDLTFANDAAELLLENPFKILNPYLHWCLCANTMLHDVG
jgi:hypothetical protein